MLKPKLLNILLYLFVKYLIFDIFQLVKEYFNGFKSWGIHNGQGFFYYLVYTQTFTLIFMLLFSAPIYFTFKVKNIIYFILLMSVILVAEYFVYVYLTSHKLLNTDGIINEIISLLLLLLFFLKPIRLIIKQSIK